MKNWESFQWTEVNVPLKVNNFHIYMWKGSSFLFLSTYGNIGYDQDYQ